MSVPTMPSYQCHETVRALQISAVTHVPAQGPPNPRPAGAYLAFGINDEPIFVDQSWFNRNQPDSGGYFIEHQDKDENFVGRFSYLPREIFESRYSPVKDTAEVELSSTRQVEC